MNRSWPMAAAVLALGVMVVLVAYDWARLAALQEAMLRGQQRIGLYAATIRTALDRYSYLPAALSKDSDIRRMLINRFPESIADISLRLEAINTVAQSAALYVMDPDGHTLAASNWNLPISYVGQNYGFRPYFLDARGHRHGRFFGVGLTTKRPGYFIAAAIHDFDDRFLGAVVVKIDLDVLERDWEVAGEPVLVTDHNGVAILTSRPQWRYTVERPLDDAMKARLAVAQRYGDEPIRPLEARDAQPIDGHSRMVTIDGVRYVSQRQRVPGEDWDIQYLTDWDAALGTARSTAAMAGSGWAALVLLVLYLRQRQLGIRAKAEAQAAVEDTLRRARDELERTVTARTAALRAAQDELVHAGKMAALGQMSAGMAHEINQPLTAIRTFLASTRIFLERGDTATVGANLEVMADLATRMANITQHLKVFARKSPVTFQPVSLAEAVTRALHLMDGPLTTAGVEVTTELEPVLVAGDQLRLEQVFVNLIRNALDAMAGVSSRRLAVTMAVADGACLVRVADSGPGIAPEAAERLFEPFFTTKEVGDGLGLGLSLSYGIIRDMGGGIHAEAGGPAGGAVFVIHLPVTEGAET